MNDMNDFNAGIIEEFRANGGKVGGPFEGMPMVVLHTTGARSGIERVVPLAYLDVDGTIAVFASKAGAPTNPDWYHNLVANPTVTVEVGTEVRECTARVLTGAERDGIWERQMAESPRFAEYEAATSRTIPVVVLEPVR
jgi:deazaflavin-dependent oxidoreductase (nitroreductase family)